MQVAKAGKTTIVQEKIGKLHGQDVFLFTLSNEFIKIDITGYGATIMAIEVPDRLGHVANIVAGFDQFDKYLDNPHCMGCVIGRYANRIGYGKFWIGENKYQLTLNETNGHLHGGHDGFQKKIWEVEKLITEKDRVGVKLSCNSKAGEEGYPGDLKASVTYILNTKNELLINFEATTDQPTIINLVNHTYFNLTGFEAENIHDHELQIFADSYTVKDERKVPTGEIVPVENTAFDFLQPKKIGKDIDQMPSDKGYDHNYRLDHLPGKIALAASLYEPVSGRKLNILTDQPGLQLYTANWWDGTLVGAQKKPYQKHAAVALEAQDFPDAPNHANFPNTILRPGEVYNRTTIFQFQNN